MRVWFLKLHPVRELLYRKIEKSSIYRDFDSFDPHLQLDMKFWDNFYAGYKQIYIIYIPKNYEKN